MSENIYREPVSGGNAESADAGRSVFSGDGRLERMFEEGIPVKYIPKILLVAVLLVLYIMNSYLIEKKRIRIQKVKAEIEDLRTDYTTMQASFKLDGLQSNVAERVRDMGLKESSTPPYRIVVRKNK